MQPSTTSDSVVEINAEDVCLSTLPWSCDDWPRTTHDVDVIRHPRGRGSHLQHLTDDVERNADEDLRRVEEKLTRIERQLNSQFQQYERRLRPPVVKDAQVKYCGLSHRFDLAGLTSLTARREQLIS